MVPDERSRQAQRAKRRFCLTAALGCQTVLAIASAQAEPVETPAFTGSIERHRTSNALDSDHAISDWYTLLRGTLQHHIGGDDANLKLGAQFQATRYDEVSIEDDRALALSAEAFRRLSPGLELRGTLSYRVSSEGDDLPIGPVILGTRTTKQVFGAQGQLGIDLGRATSLILSIADSFEKVGPTHFQQNLISPVQLDPDLNRFQLAAKITRTIGRFAFGGSASALWVAVQELGIPPVAYSLAEYTLSAEGAYAGEDGSTFGLALGAQLLRGADGIYERLRPTWQLTFAKPLPHGFDLRGTYFGRYETVDSDDPLASWLQRAEFEIGWKSHKDLALASGIFGEIKENLLFENEERSRGIYAEATYSATAALAVVFRVDVSETFKTMIDIHERTVDAFVGLRAKI